MSGLFSMAVYVDNMQAPFGRMIMCHMNADTTKELLDMATKIGVQHKWIQDAGTYQEHFDIALSKRALAVQHGAIEISRRELGDLLASKKEKTPVLPAGIKRK